MWIYWQILYLLQSHYINNNNIDLYASYLFFFTYKFISMGPNVFRHLPKTILQTDISHLDIILSQRQNQTFWSHYMSITLKLLAFNQTFLGFARYYIMTLMGMIFGGSQDLTSRLVKKPPASSSCWPGVGYSHTKPLLPRMMEAPHGRWWKWVFCLLISDGEIWTSTPCPS